MKESQKKVIYLDFDGVINGDETPCITLKTMWGVENTHIGLCPDLVDKINQIHDATGASVWVHSSWRDAYSEEQIGELLLNAGLRAPYEGNIPNSNGRRMDSLYSARGPDIRAHVESHGIEKYVILDDMGPSFFEFEDRSFHVQTDSSSGIKNADVQMAVEILNS